MLLELGLIERNPRTSASSATSVQATFLQHWGPQSRNGLLWTHSNNTHRIQTSVAVEGGEHSMKGALRGERGALCAVFAGL